MKQKTSPVTLKQIRVWKVALYSLLTFGIYTVVWFVKRYRELADPKPKVPHWILLISIVSLVAFGFIGLFVASYMESDTRRGAELFIYGTYAVAILVTIGYAWWFGRYALVIGRATQAPLSRALTISLAIFFAPALALMLQYVINRPLASRPSLGRPLSYISAVVIAMSLGLTISQYIRQPIDTDITLFSQELEATKRSVAKQQACLDAVTDKSSVDATKACFEMK